MRSITEIVEEIVQKEPLIAYMLSQNLLNRSEYARKISDLVATRAKKPVNDHSIAVALGRLKKKGRGPDLLGHIPIQQMSLHANLSELVTTRAHVKTSTLNALLKKVESVTSGFLTFSVSAEYASFLFNTEIEHLIYTTFPNNITLNRELCAVTVQFSAKLIKRPNIGYYFLSRLTYKNIPFVKVYTTHNEFTLVVTKRYYNELLQALN